MRLEHATLVKSILRDSGFHMQCLATVRDLKLPDCFIGAGFVRNAVWDHLHGFKEITPLDDLDVLFFQPSNLSKEFEQSIEDDLLKRKADTPWSVRNQARMHLRNNDQPYQSTEDAMMHWLETATCVAARLDSNNELNLAAPYGLADLVNMKSRPTPAGKRRFGEYCSRMEDKIWPSTWHKVDVLFE